MRLKLRDSYALRYTAGLDARKRSEVAACHIYIAQAHLQDDYAAMGTFSKESRCAAAHSDA